MSIRTTASLLIGFVFCGLALVAAQTVPPGSATPGPQAPRAQTPARDPNGNPTQAPTGTGIIRGRVTAADSGNPLRRAQVRIAGNDVRVNQTANTDGDGRYEFSKVPAGRYSISVMRNGYVSLQFGQQRPFEPGKPLNLAEGEVAEKIDFVLPRGGVITGRVTDEAGEPMAGARLQVMRYQYNPNGQRQLMQVGGMGSPFGFITDDLGQFRVYGLMPGTYVLSASSAMNGVMMAFNPGESSTTTRVNVRGDADENNGYVTTYYPGTANPEEAQAITVGLAQETSAYFSMIPSRLSRISGVVHTSQGRPAAGSMVMVRTAIGAGFNMSGGGQVAPDGSFSVQNVPPGEHFLDIRPGPGRPMIVTTAPGAAGTAPPEPEFASVPITVSGQDITGLVITTTLGAAISGRVVFDGTRPIPAAQAGQPPLRIMANPVDVNGPPMAINPNENGTVDESGRFQLRGVAGRVLFRLFGVLPGWFLKSVTMNGADITDMPFDVRSNATSLEVVLTDQQTTLSGTVKNSRGDVVKDYVLAVLPENLKEGVSPLRFTRTVRPDQNGQYKTQGLPPGDYVAFAVETMEQGINYDPAYQQAMKPRGRSFRLSDGQTLSLDLQLVQ
jgi:hypothetical protein